MAKHVRVKRSMNFLHCWTVVIATVFFGTTSATLAQQLGGTPPGNALAVLEKSADSFMSVLDLIEQVDWQFRPKGYRHTIGEMAEHTALSHQALQGLITKALRRDANPERARGLAGKEDLIRRRMLENLTRPENFRAKSILLSKAEVIEYFQRAHKKALQLLRSAESRNLLDVHIYRHPTSQTYGELTASQWFYYLAYHTQRHARAIRRITQLPEFTGE